MCLQEPVITFAVNSPEIFYEKIRELEIQGAVIIVQKHFIGIIIIIVIIALTVYFKNIFYSYPKTKL